MKQEDLVGKVRTVLGLVSADDLGITLPHEHLLSDGNVWFAEPTDAIGKKISRQPISLKNLWWIKTHTSSHVDNIRLDDEQIAIEEAMLFKQAGGNTIVEATSIGTARNPLGLVRIARATGLNIVMGSSYYIGASHPPEIMNMSEEEIAEGIVRDIVVGVGDTGVCAGIIGEIGCSMPLEDGERKVLRASAIAQQRTEAAISIHPSPRDDLALEIVNILSNAGANLARTVISHVDAWNYNVNTCREIVNAGCYIEYESFGQEGIYIDLEGSTLEQLAHDDVQLVTQIMQLIAEGYLNQILISQDIYFKHQLVTYGGYGYAHILRDIVPVMQHKGMSDEEIRTLLMENPKRLLSFASVKE